ncbi:MAG: glycosyltransferase family 87 protein [Acidimicrobiales bacterium]
MGRAPVLSHRLVRYAAGVGLFAAGVGTTARGAIHGGDFRLSLWYPGQALLHGRNPYDVASFQRYYGAHQIEVFSRGWFPLYGPVHLWLAVVLGALPVSVAAGVWFAVNVGGLAAIGAVVTRALDRRLGVPAVLAVTGILALTRPGRATLEIGQATIFYTLVSYVAWSQARRRPWLAAVALALALGKPPFGLPLLALVLARRLWPVVARGLVLFVAASLPIVIWLSVNAGSPAALWRSVVHNLSYTEHNRLDAPGSSGRIDGLSLVARYVHSSFGGGAEVAAFVVVIAAAAIAATRASRRPGWPTSPAVLVVLGTATMLAVAHEYYDLLLLAWPFAAALRAPVAAALDAMRAPAGNGAGGEPRRAGRRGLLALCAVPALVVTIIPARATLKLFGLGSSTGGLSTLTTVSLLVALAGAAATLARAPSEDDAGASADVGVDPGGGASERRLTAPRR